METLFATIAQIAAAIIAILGGFIVTKLITLVSERNEIQVKLDEITNNLKVREHRIKELRTELLEDEALVVITKHLNELKPELFDKVYKRERHEYKKEDLRPLWDKACAIAKQLPQEIAQENAEPDENGIPVTFAEKLGNFEYAVCCHILKNSAHQIKPEENHAVHEELKDHEAELRIFILQEKQLVARQLGITMPRSMLVGLLVFIGYAAVSIVYPIIILMNINGMDSTAITVNEWVAISLFVVGLISTMAYIVLIPRISIIKKEKQKK